MRALWGVATALLACTGLAAPVDAVCAKKAAQAWIDGGYSMRKLSDRTVTDVASVEIGIERAHIARLSDGGIVVLPADDRIDPVIAFSPSSVDVPSDVNSPLQTLLARDLAVRMAAVTNAPMLKMATVSASVSQTPAQRRWAKLLGRASGPRLMAASGAEVVSDVRVAPLVQSRWSQENNSVYSNWGNPCFNYYTPGNYPCGCVATALAQLMRYHRYPASAVAVSRTCSKSGYSSTYTMKGGAYDYDAMPLVPEAYSGLAWYAGGATEAQRKAIGKLTYDCGVAMQMAWGYSGSSSGGAAAYGPLKDVFGYANAHTTIYAAGLASSAYRERIIHANLDAGYPVMLGIGRSGYSGGHEVLADGYGYSDSVAYTHINMGWANEEDIWYALPDIGSDYNVIDGAVYNVFPDESGEIVSGRVVDGSGNPVAGASVSIKFVGASSNLKTSVSRDSGVFGFVVPSARAYVVTATFGTGSASTSVTTGTSVDSKVTLDVGCYSYSISAPNTAVACGNVSCGDVVLSSVAAVQAPVISPNGGLFYPTATVSISCATAGATIRYTLDGSDPTEASVVYTVPFTLADDTVVKARAFKSGMNPSIVVPATFTYDVAQGGVKGDYYSKPIQISGASGSYETGDNADYTLETDEVNHTLVVSGCSSSSYSQDRTCWFTWTAPGSGTMTFKSKFTYWGYAFQTVVAVYPDLATVPSDTSSRLAMDYATGMEEASTSFQVTQGTTYRIVVGALTTSYSGPYTFTWSGSLTVVDPGVAPGGETPYTPSGWTTPLAVDNDWLIAQGVAKAGDSAATVAAKLAATGANGIPRYQSYVLGMNPESSVPAEEQLKVTFEGFDANGAPIVSYEPVPNVPSHVKVRKLGRNSLPTAGNAGWTEVTPGTEANYNFFKVAVELNK